MQREAAAARNADGCMWIRSSALFRKSLYEKGRTHGGWCEKSETEGSTGRKEGMLVLA